MKSLVVFYSLTNKTKLVAETIAEALAAELLEIKETEIRKPGGLLHLKGGFEALKNKESKIAPIQTDLNQYDKVFIGSPIWASRPTPAINSFIKINNFWGIDVVPFFTMAGNNSNKALKNITAKIGKSSGKVIGSFAIKSHRLTDEEIKSMAKETVKHYSA